MAALATALLHSSGGHLLGRLAGSEGKDNDNLCAGWTSANQSSSPAVWSLLSSLESIPCASRTRACRKTQSKFKQQEGFWNGTGIELFPSQVQNEDTFRLGERHVQNKRSRNLTSTCSIVPGRKHKNSILDSILDVADPREHYPSRPSQRDVAQAWEILRNDVLYLDYRARQDVLAIKCAHDKVVEALNPAAKEQKSISSLRDELQVLQDELAEAHAQVHLSEARVEHTLQRLADMEAIVSDKLLTVAERPPTKTDASKSTQVLEREEQKSETHTPRSKSRLDVSGPVAPYNDLLKNYWYPVAFSRDVDATTLVPFDSFEEAWVLFRGADGRPGCLRDQCAHRACPLSLGTVTEGRVQCAYHGWEFNTSGACEKMPSTKLLSVGVQSLPCVEHDGMIWIWPGSATPEATMPSLPAPKGFTIHAEIVIELPVEHGLLVENLLDLAHAPFTHTSTFAKGWSVPSMVRFKTAAAEALLGHWDPYPIDMEFRPPCMVLSTIGLAKPGQLDGKSAKDCKKHLFQLHSCMPSSRGKTRLLYRMALDFAQWAKYVPFIELLWQNLANKVLAEDLRLVLGQQDRMERGANVWSNPVGYDKLGVRYRRWRHAVEDGDAKTPFI